MAQHRYDSARRLSRKDAEWTPFGVLSFVDREVRQLRMTQDQGRMAKASLHLVFRDRLPGGLLGCRYRDDDYQVLSDDFLQSSDHRNAKRVAFVFRQTLSTFIDANPSPEGPKFDKPTGSELVAAFDRRTSDLTGTLRSCYGEHWSDRHVLTPEVEAAIDNAAVSPGMKSNRLSLVRQALRTLAEKRPDANYVMVADRRVCLPGNDLSPTGLGILNANELAYRDGSMTARERSERRTAVRLVLKGLLGERWESEPLHRHPLESMVQSMAAEKSLFKDAFTDLRAAVQTYREAAPFDYGIDLKPPKRHRSWEAQSDFPPTARGIVALITQRVEEGDGALHKRNLKPAVKWVIASALKEADGWEDQDLGGTDPLELLERISPSATLRNYASRYRSAIYLYAAEFPDAFSELPTRSRSGPQPAAIDARGLA